MGRRFTFWISRHQAELLLGLRMTVASLLAFALAAWFALPQGYFAVLTTVIVMHGSVGGSVNATLYRLIGTFGGAEAKQIASVTKPISVAQNGTLFVAVKTNAWMTELSLMEPQILRALNAKAGRARVRKIRLQLMR